MRLHTAQVQPARTGIILAAIALVLSTVIAIASAPAALAVGENVFLSEIHYDNTGSDTGEFFEISGDAGVDVSAWSVVLYNGNGGTEYATVSLSGTIDDEGDGLGALSFLFAGIQNGSPDGLALIDDGGNVVEFLSYEGSIVAVGGPADGMTSTDIGVSEPGTTPIGESLQLVDGTWTGPAAASPGTLNDGDVPPPPPPPPGGTVFIHEVQGSGIASPLAGQTVTIEGIVVGDFQEIVTADAGDTALLGFFVQEEDADADADPNTSEGIFVYDPDASAAVSVGDLVEVTGPVTEFFDLTEIAFPTDVTVISNDNALPSPATPTVPTTVGDTPVDWEAIEGMSVSFSQTLYVTGLFPLGAYGEIQLSAIGAQDHPNQTNAVGSAGAAEQAQLNIDTRVILDDGEDESEAFPTGIPTWNPTPTPYLQAPDNTIRSGDEVTALSGVVHFAWGEYEVHPVNLADALDPDSAVDVTRTNARPGTPDVGGSLKVANFNVLNYFTTIDTGGALCGPPGSEQGCRGADSAAEFATQSAKIVDAIIDLDADIVGLVEIENNNDGAVADLVTRLNSDPDATRSYDYVATGYLGTDAITVAAIYDTATVAPSGAFAALDSSVSPAFIDDKNRVALAQTFEELATGGTVTIAVNHLKSKGSSCDTVENPGDAAFGVAGYAAGEDIEDPNFQGNCNLTRTAAAQVLGQWLEADPTGTASDNVLILGDLNAYANEDPITALESLGYIDLVEAAAGGNSFALSAHSYVFDGEHGTLDYAMANGALNDAVVGAAVWHINADEPFAIDYQDFNPPGQATLDEFKSSDHDPVVVGLDLDAGPPPTDLCNGLTPTIIGAGTIVGTNGADIILGSEGDDFIIGRRGNDIICGGGGDDIIRGGGGADIAFGDAGDDALYGQSGNDTLDGGADTDYINGGGGRGDVCLNGETVIRCEL